MIYFAMRNRIQNRDSTLFIIFVISLNIYKLFLSLHNDLLLILFCFSPELICFLNEMYSVPRTLQCDCV